MDPNRLKLLKVIEDTEDYLESAKNKLNKIRNILKNCNPSEYENTLKLFKNETANIFKQIYEHGNTIFKVIESDDQLNNSQEFSSNDNVNSETHNHSFANIQPTHSKNLNSDISNSADRNLGNSLKSLAQLSMPEETTLSEALQFNMPSTSRSLVQYIKSEHKSKPNRKLDVNLAYDLPDERPMEVDENLNSINLTTIGSKKLATCSCESVQELLADEEIQIQASIVDDNYSPSQVENSQVLSDSELHDQYKVCECEIVLDSSLIRQARKSRQFGMKKSAVKSAVKAATKIEEERALRSSKKIAHDESDSDSYDARKARVLMEGTRHLLDSDDDDDETPNKPSKKDGHSSKPSTSKAANQNTVDSVVELSEDDFDVNSGEKDVKVKKSFSKKSNLRGQANKVDKTKAAKSSGPIILSSDEENSINDADLNKDDEKMSEVSDSDEDSVTDDLLKIRLPRDRACSNKQRKNEVKQSDKAKHKRKHSSDSSVCYISEEEGNDEEELSKEEQNLSADSGTQEISSDEESLKKKPKRVTRSATKKTKKVTKAKKKNVANPKKKSRIMAMDSEEDEDMAQKEDDGEETKDKPDEKVRFRKMISRKKLTKETINAEVAEKERRKRLEQRQLEFNGIELFEGDGDLYTALQQSNAAKQRVKSVVLDLDSKSDDPIPVEVHQSLVRVIKPHQAKGIQFIYNSVFERLEFLLDEDKKNLSYGGILAHCMGLGKTLQVIAFLHTILVHEKLKNYVRRVIVLAPKNVVINWKKEFDKWLFENDQDLDEIDVIEMGEFSNNKDRLAALKNWYESDKPSVAILGYEMFRILTEDEDDTRKKKADPKKPKNKKKKAFLELQKKFRQYLQDPGADLIVCDEAHKLKNDESALSKTVSKIATKRRLCLTGTPLQNNLMEYHCMINFVKPGVLGTKKEFSNRFKNIIERGRHKDASGMEVRAMRKRCHVLYDQLKMVLDRKDYRVLIDAIPPKNEYIIKIRLTDPQIELYKHFLGLSFNENSQQEKIASGSNGRKVLIDYHVFARIWTHPYQLIQHEREMERKRMLQDDAEDLENFVVSDEETSEGDSNNSGDENAGPSTSIIDSEQIRRKSRRLAGEEAERAETPPEYNQWFSALGLVSEDDRNNCEMSNKLILLISIIKKCEKIGDKLLVFSQSIETLNLIKRLLRYLGESGIWWNDGHEALMCQEDDNWSWIEDVDYLYIDGQVSSKNRANLQERFNDPAELRSRLMLISTRAGSLGTNMIGANRVIIFDACWNPSHDNQSLFRVYRFGQTKPVYIYRFIAQGTMEEKIYKRQVTKESTAMRVIDESSIKRHFNRQEVEELYVFDPDIWDDDNEKEVAGTFDPRKDKLLAEIVEENMKRIVEITPHDSLYDEDPIEKMTQQEKEEAWDEYNKEKSNPNANHTSGLQAQIALSNSMMTAYQQQVMAENIINAARKELFLKETETFKGRQRILEDPIYLQCFGIANMNQDIAARIVYIKRALDELMPSIPIHMRGGINEFGSYFCSIIQECYKVRETPDWLLTKSISVFRTVVSMVKDVEECKRLLRIIYASNPQLFEPSTAHLLVQ